MIQSIVSARGPSIAVLVALGGLFAASFQSPPKHHDSAMTPKMAGEIFAQRCSTCHVAPDLAYATDRAWVEQVNETA